MIDHDSFFLNELESSFFAYLNTKFGPKDDNHDYYCSCMIQNIVGIHTLIIVLMTTFALKSILIVAFQIVATITIIVTFIFLFLV